MEKNELRRSFLRKVLSMTAIGFCSPLMSFVEKNGSKTPSGPTTKIEGKKGITILFQGDSITDGARIKTNTWDQNHQLGHGYVFTLAAKIGYKQPKKNFQFVNRGVGGNTLSDLQKRWQEDTIDMKPDLLTVLIGVNDVDAMMKTPDNIDQSIKSFEINYRQLLTNTKKSLPNIKLFILEPFMAPVGRVKAVWDLWSNTMITIQQITRQLANEFDAEFIPLQQHFNNLTDKDVPVEYWIWDGIHPTPPGHELIATQWLNSVSKIVHQIQV